MKNKIQNAIRKINWTKKGVIDHIISNQRNHEAFYRDKIYDYFNGINSSLYYKEKELNLVSCQRVDLVEINLEKFLGDFIYDDIRDLQMPVSNIVEFGHNNTCQSAEYNINKTISDIKKRTLGQNLHNLYTVQVVVDIKKVGADCYLSNTYCGDLKGNTNMIKDIDMDFFKLDPNMIKETVSVATPKEAFDIHFYICGPFSKENWNLIVNNFLSYKTSSGKKLKIIYENKILK